MHQSNATYNFSQSTLDCQIEFPENGSRCWHLKRFGIVIIRNEMKSFNPPQWGITWRDENCGKSKGYGKYYHSYWNDKNEIRILGNKSMEELSDEFNFKSSQAELLLELCDNDLSTLEELFLKLRLKLHGPPGTKSELNQILNYRSFKSWQ